MSSYIKRDYRGTSEFNNALLDVKKQVKKMLKHTEVISFTHSKESLLELLEGDSEDIDFNDQEIVALCKEHNLYLLTDDGDFKDCDISVISSNKKYFTI